MSARADEAIAKHLAEHAYHPRSSRHGDMLCELLLLDLLGECEVLRRTAEAGRIVFCQNYTIEPDSPDRWNADLVVGPPGGEAPAAARRVGPLAEGKPMEIWIAIDAKTIMTEHGKARRNRQRDLNSFQDILHRKNPRTIVGGLVLVNMAERFQSPLARAAEGPTEHRNVERLVEEIITMLGGLARATPDKPGLEALGVIVVSHTNIKKDKTRLITVPPAPQSDHALHYGTFLRDLCQKFGERFGGAG